MSEVSYALKQLPNVTTYMCLEEDVSSPVMYPIICGLLKKHLATVEGELCFQSFPCQLFLLIGKEA
jgi:hypothetical protein